jgi:DNA-binding NtrC family response regulator
MRLGAYDYVTKGQDDLVKLEVVVKNVREREDMARELENLRTEVAERYGMEGLVGDSAAMESVYRLVQKAVRGDLTVAIQGESGTGKELVARAIHYNSPRKRGPFVVVNCAAIPHDLMESEFFGHEKGSFTGAHARKIGKFEQADGGTIFLDEIGEMNLDLQAKLLRALQNYEIQRVGGNETIHFDARVISATNRNVADFIREGRFREDLYYRLFQFPINLPPLRDRSQDTLLLADHFLSRYVETHSEFEGTRLSSDARRAISEYPWPGNVRELKSAVERAVLLAEGKEIRVPDLMLEVHADVASWASRQGGPARASTQHARPDRGIPGAPSRDQALLDGAGASMTLEEIKRRAIEGAYRRCDGNVDKAAVELEIGRATMYRLLKKYGLME